MFSIVVPLYNKSYSVKRCIDSLLSQRYKNYEIIVVNDGSTDSSLSVLTNSYKSEIQNGCIKIINQHNQGVSVARNNGVQASRFNYICFLDADDEWKPGFLDEIYYLITECPLADLYCLAHFVSKNGSVPRKPKHGLPDGFIGYIDNFFKVSLKGDVANSSKVCVRKEALSNIGGFPDGGVTGEDLYTWIMLALNGKVACSMKYNTIVHQVLDASRFSRINSVPYPLFYFSKSKKHKKNYYLNRYLFKIFYVHFLHSLFNFRIKEAGLRLFYAVKMFF